MFKPKIVAAIGVLLFLTFAITSIVVEVPNYVMDSILFAVITAFFYFTYDYWKLNIPIYVLLILAMASHAAGMFGFYYQTPIAPFEWDDLTHFLPAFALAVFFMNYFKAFMDRTIITKRNLFFILVSFLASIGIGAIIENIEYTGYLVVGFGEGGFAFGAGDALPGQNETDFIQAIGGGWINTMNDMLWNDLGAVAGILVSLILLKRK